MTFARRGSAQNCPLNSLETLPDVVAPCCEPSCGDSMVRPCIANQIGAACLGGTADRPSCGHIRYMFSSVLDEGAQSCPLLFANQRDQHFDQHYSIGG